MNDLQQYLSKRKTVDSEFAENYEEGYQSFKFGVLLKEARKDAGYTQLDLADKLHTQKSAIFSNRKPFGRCKTLYSRKVCLCPR